MVTPIKYVACYLVILLACVLTAQGVSAAESPLDTLRIMAENDVVGAYAEVQRLRAELADTAPVVEHVQLLNLQARIEFVLALAEQADTHSNQALIMAERNNDAVGQAEALLNLAKIALNQGKLALSTELTFRSANLVPDSGYPGLTAEVMFWQVLAYRRMGKEQESVKTALQALELAQQNEDVFALAYAYRGLALSYEQSHHTAEAYTYSEQMLYYAKKLPSKLFEAYSLQGLASRAGQHQDADAAELLMRQAIALYRQLQAPFSLSIGQMSLAQMLAQQGRHAERVMLLDDVIGIYQQYPNPLGQWYALTARSDAYQQLNQLHNAEQDAQAALQVALQIADWSLHQQSLELLAKIAALRQDYVTAYQLTVESAQLVQQSKLQASHSNTDEVVTNYEQERQQRQIEQLNKHNAEQAVLIRQEQMRQRWLFTILISCMLLLNITMYFLLRLKRGNAELRGLAARLEEIREEERKRIARDLHDEMGQYLTTLRLEISAIDMIYTDSDPVLSERTQALKALVDKTIHVMRDIAASLRPAPLDMGGISALEWLAEEFSRRTGIACNIDVGSADINLSDKFMTALFRIVQESLTNITRHANATEVRIVLAITQRDLSLQIVDNGRGFDPADVQAQSFGLTGMRERALMLGGELIISSVINKGTTVSVSAQLPKEEQSDD